MDNWTKIDPRSKRNQRKCLNLIELEKKLLALDIILPHKKEIEISLLPTFLAFDSTAYKTCQQIKIENKQQKIICQRNRVLYQRANRLQKFIEESKSQLGSAFEQFNNTNSISLELSQIKDPNQHSNRQQVFDILHSIKSKKQHQTPNQLFDLSNQKNPRSDKQKSSGNHLKNQKRIIEICQPTKQKIVNSFEKIPKNKNYTKAMQDNIVNQNINSLNFKTQIKYQQNRKIERKVQKLVLTHQDLQIRELKRSQYHKRSQTSSDLRVLCGQNTSKKQLKIQPKQSITYEDYFSRSRTPKIIQINKQKVTRKSSYSPKVQNSISPIDSHIHHERLSSNIEHKKKKHQQYQKSQQQKYLSNDLYSKKEDVSIYVQTQDLQKEENIQNQKRSLELLDKFAKKTDRSLFDIEKQINDLKQKVCQLHESRIMQRKNENRIIQIKQTEKLQPSKIKGSSTSVSATNSQPINNKHQVKSSYLQFYSNPGPVQQQEIWECEQDQLQQEIKYLNQQISQRNLLKQVSPNESLSIVKDKPQKYHQAQRLSLHLKKPSQKLSKSPRISCNNMTQRVSNGNTKCVRLDLTPDKFGVNKTPKGNKEKYRQTQIQLLVQQSRMIPQNSTRCFSSKTPKRLNQKEFAEDLKHNRNIQCSKWQKKGIKKQLLSAKIANLRQ